ncbi:UNVERIFIED_CONTAM: hypothetical protein H355_014624 [Colinus virginianus]|nr:hypothetical protein H355_014624 [Colinus virginianus]
MEADEVSIREQNFHSQVREYTICFLLFAVLYIVSYFIITRYKRKADEQEDEDAIVNRISPLGILPPIFIFLYITDGMLVTSVMHTSGTFTDVYSNGSVAGETNMLILIASIAYFLFCKCLKGVLFRAQEILEDLDEQMYIITLEEEAIQRKLNGMLVLLLLQIQYLEYSAPSYEH